jgi:hypothetical protein
MRTLSGRIITAGAASSQKLPVQHARRSIARTSQAREVAGSISLLGQARRTRTSYSWPCIARQYRHAALPAVKFGPQSLARRSAYAYGIHADML